MALMGCPIYLSEAPMWHGRFTVSNDCRNPLVINNKRLIHHVRVLARRLEEVWRQGFRALVVPENEHQPETFGYPDNRVLPRLRAVR